VKKQGGREGGREGGRGSEIFLSLAEKKGTKPSKKKRITEKKERPLRAEIETKERVGMGHLAPLSTPSPSSKHVFCVVGPRLSRERNPKTTTPQIPECPVTLPIARGKATDTIHASIQSYPPNQTKPHCYFCNN